VYQQQEQQQQEQEQQQDAENPFLDPPFSRIKRCFKDCFLNVTCKILYDKKRRASAYVG
jgi:hypothetical protein